MIRLHPDPNGIMLTTPYSTDEGIYNRYIVSARRKTRGHIVWDTETTNKIHSYSRYHAEQVYTVRTGWRPVGLNGVKGSLYPSKKKAVEALVSQHRFWVNNLP